MILGIGTDIVRIDRIRRLIERHGERAAARILAPSETEAFADARDPAAFLAKRFAAKEAFAKALGTGVREPVTLHGVSVAHDARGRPLLKYSGALRAMMDERGLAAHLSLSDETDVALAFVVIEQPEKTI